MVKIIGILFGASLAVSFFGIMFGAPICNIATTCPDTAEFQETVKTALNSALHMANTTFTTMNTPLNLCGNSGSFWKGLTICSDTSNLTLLPALREQFSREHCSENFTDELREKVLAESTCYLPEWTMTCTNPAYRFRWMRFINLLHVCPGCSRLNTLNSTCSGYFMGCQTEEIEGSLFQAMLVSYERQLQNFTHYRNRIDESCQD